MHTSEVLDPDLDLACFKQSYLAHNSLQITSLLEILHRCPDDIHRAVIMTSLCKQMLSIHQSLVLLLCIYILDVGIYVFLVAHVMTNYRFQVTRILHMIDFWQEKKTVLQNRAARIILCV